MRAKYCKSKNTYTIDGCKNCKCPEYWKQGIGRIYAEPAVNETFDITFDQTFK